MKKFYAFLIVAVLLVSLACNACAISPNALPQIRVKMNESNEGLKVGQGEYGGITLVMPDNHKNMLMTFYWDAGGFVDFKFYNYNDELVWDSYSDALFFGASVCTHEYSLSSYQRVRNYEIGSNVAKIIVYCSDGDQVCTTQSEWNAGINAGYGEKGISAGLSLGYSYGKNCSEMYYYASLSYGNVCEK